jgi:hypothetical protein
MEPMSSARAATDTRHRIKTANSQPRRIKLIGLPTGGAGIVRGIDSATLRDVQTLIADGSPDLLKKLDGAEMIFLVACSGDDLSLAPQIKQVARDANVMITGILVQTAGGPDTARADLGILRPSSDMLIVATDASYVTDMLAQLGA